MLWGFSNTLTPQILQLSIEVEGAKDEKGCYRCYNAWSRAFKRGCRGNDCKGCGASPDGTWTHCARRAAYSEGRRAREERSCPIRAVRHDSCLPRQEHCAPWRCPGPNLCGSLGSGESPRRLKDQPLCIESCHGGNSDQL